MEAEEAQKTRHAEIRFSDCSLAMSATCLPNLTGLHECSHHVLHKTNQFRSSARFPSLPCFVKKQFLRARAWPRAAHHTRCHAARTPSSRGLAAHVNASSSQASRTHHVTCAFRALIAVTPFELGKKYK